MYSSIDILLRKKKYIAKIDIILHKVDVMLMGVMFFFFSFFFGFQTTINDRMDLKSVCKVNLWKMTFFLRSIETLIASDTKKEEDSI